MPLTRRKRRSFRRTSRRCEPLASQESVVVRHSRWIAALPFGVGQFQNGQEGLGYALLVSEALLAGASITSGVIYMELLADYTRQQSSKARSTTPI